MPSVAQILAAERSLALSRLRCALDRYAPSLERMPSLHQEMHRWLEDPELDLECIAERQQNQLQAISDFWVKFDALPESVRSQSSLQAYTQRLCTQAHAGNLLAMLASAHTEIDSARRSAEIQAAEHARRQAEDQAVERALQDAAAEAQAENFRRLKREQAAAETLKREEERKKEFLNKGYIYHGDGTVTDTKTGLMWKQHTEDKKYSWDEAMNEFRFSFKKAFKYAGHSDWRIPTSTELKTLPLNDTNRIDQEIIKINRENIWSSDCVFSFLTTLSIAALSPLIAFIWLRNLFIDFALPTGPFHEVFFRGKYMDASTRRFHSHFFDKKCSVLLVRTDRPIHRPPPVAQ